METGKRNPINMDDLANGKTVRVIELGASFREKQLPTIEQMLDNLTIGGGITIGQVANKSISELTDDELIQLFATVPMPSKLPFLEEMKRRDIKSFVLDLGDDATEEMLMESMESFALLVGDQAEHTISFGRTRDGMTEYKPDVKQLLIGRKSNAHLLKKKEPKFYQELNKKRSR